jgi:hypothetical protein
MFEPLVDELAALERSIKHLDRAVEAKAEPACRLLMTLPAVGPVTALAYLATIDEAGRFGKSRALGAYLGLTLRRNQSGEMDYSGRISKQGDSLLGALLYGAANSLAAPGASRPPLEGLGTPGQEADQPQEGLRGLGPQAGGDHASHVGDRRSLRLAAGRHKGDPNCLA